MKISKNPLAPWLPEPFGRMTRQQLNAESDQYDAEFAAVDTPRVTSPRPHPKKCSRPRSVNG
jgi:hypothetical protein